MKDFIILIVILLCIIAMGIWQINYLEETGRYMKTDLEYVKYYINLDKFEQAEEKIKIAQNTWKSIKNIWALFIHHDDIDEMEIYLTEIDSNIKVLNLEETNISIDKAIKKIDCIKVNEELNIENIF